jgi:hypothetical protein
VSTEDRTIERRIKEAFEPIRLPSELSSIQSAGRRRRRARRATMLAPIVVVGVAAVLAQTLLPGTQRSSAAAATLTRLAAAAAQQPAQTVGPGQYAYSEFNARWQTCQGSDCVWEPVHRETWIAPDGSGRITETRGGYTWSEEFRPGELIQTDLSKVPTEEGALRSFIEERAAKADQPLEYEMFVRVGDLLRESFSSPLAYNSPDLRSALFKVAASLPGVQLLGDTTDESGRHGVAVGYAYQGTLSELIFDPATSALLGEREVQIDDGITVPGSWRVLLQTAVVSSTNDQP